MPQHLSKWLRRLHLLLYVVEGSSWKWTGNIFFQENSNQSLHVKLQILDARCSKEIFCSHELLMLYSIPLEQPAAALVISVFMISSSETPLEHTLIRILHVYIQRFHIPAQRMCFKNFRYTIRTFHILSSWFCKPSKLNHFLLNSIKIQTQEVPTFKTQDFLLGNSRILQVLDRSSLPP